MYEKRTSPHPEKTLLLPERECGMVWKKGVLRMDRAELLAPAGDWESLEAAVRFGADAVYVGGEKLQMRAERAAFPRDALVRAVEYAHSNSRRLYVTVNSLAKSGEIPELREYAEFLRDAGVDAVIAADLGVISEFVRAAPGLELHLSTQAGCMNYAAARVYGELGVSRIVLPRELTLNEIAELAAGIPRDLSLEAFVHGAMCMAVSGRCLISAFLTGRSGNRGECSQPCRWQYALTEEKRPGEFFPLEENGEYTALLSSHDLCCVDFLDELGSAGVSSFKIEGRMKTAYYVATVTNAYRMAIDGTASPADCRRELDAVKHRPYSSGFYFGELKSGHLNSGKYEQSCVFVGAAVEWIDGVALIVQRNRFFVGDRLEVLSPGRNIRSFTVEFIETETGERRDCAPHPGERVRISCPVELSPGDFLRRRETTGGVQDHA